MPPVHRPPATAARLAHRFGTDPFAVEAALALGATRGQLRAAVDAGALDRLRPGVLCVPVAAGEEGVRRDALAVLVALGPQSVVSHVTAGRLLGLPSRRPGESPGLVDVTAPQRGRVRAGIHLHEGLVDPADRSSVAGVRCTNMARTALDLARGRPLMESLVVLDVAVGKVGRPALGDASTRLTGRAGIAGLLRAVDLADARSESPLESASRGSMLASGLPAPELQAWVADDEGRAYRVDFLWRAQRLIGEADGWAKYTGPGDLRAEKRREDGLRRAGWRFARWTSDEVWGRDDAALVRRLRPFFS